jgi:hypothetical protein
MNLDLFTVIFNYCDLFTLKNLCLITKNVYEYSSSPYLWSLKMSKMPKISNDKSLMAWQKLYYQYRASLYGYGDFNEAYKMAHVIIKTVRIENSLNNIYIPISITSKQIIYQLLPLNFRPKSYNLITFHNNYQISFRETKIKKLRLFDEIHYVKKYNDIMINVSFEAYVYYFAVVIYQNEFTDIYDNHQNSFLMKHVKQYSSLDYRKGIMTTLLNMIDNGTITI